MKKRICAWLLCTLMLLALLPAAAADSGDRYLEINETNFPDMAFRNYITSYLPVSGNNENGYYMTEAQVMSVERLQFFGSTEAHEEVHNYQGLELFPNLKELICANYSGGTVENLYLSHLTQLTNLTLSGFPYQTIDLSKHTALKRLELYGLPITELDLSHNAKLTDLVLHINSIRSLDLTGCASLRTINADCMNLSEVNVSNNPELRVILFDNSRIRSLDVSNNMKLQEIHITSGSTVLNGERWAAGSLSELKLGSLPNLVRLLVMSNRLETLDVSGCPALEELNCPENDLQTLDVSHNPALRLLICSDNRLESLNLAANTALIKLDVRRNRLTELKLGDLARLKESEVKTDGQVTLLADGFEKTDGGVSLDMHRLVSDVSKVTVDEEGIAYDPETGIAQFDAAKAFTYRYDTECGSMNVRAELPYTGEVSFEWYEEDVAKKGATPYVIYDGVVQRPRFRIRDAENNLLDPIFYETTYANNRNPGTGTVEVALINGQTVGDWFKIYLPPTAATYVENTANGVKVTWTPVEGAKGYVIYRRAWSSTTNGWTAFARWNNTTQTTWTDTKVYAGTRYQYGVKAYFSNVMDNYNLGEVGPLKTTVRITSRTLLDMRSDKAGEITVKWDKSKNFTGYQVQIASNAKFTKDVQTVKFADPSVYYTTFKGLPSGKTYYARVRSYHVFEGMTYFGAWSAVRNRNTK